MRLPNEGEVDFRTAVGTLIGFALISQEIGGESYVIHPLVRASVHSWLEQKNEKADYTSQALQLLAEAFPTSEYEHIKTCESILAHAQAVLCYDCVLEYNMEYRAALLYNVGSFDRRQGRDVSANRKVSEAYKIDRERLGEFATTTLDDLSLLALVLRDEGDYKVAEKISRRALNGREKVLGVEHPSTLTSVNNLSSVLASQGKYKAAEEIHRRALDGWEKALGVAHPSTLSSASNLALVLQHQRKYKASEEMNRRALEGREKILGVTHRKTLSSVYSLAYLFHIQKRYNEASVLYIRASEGFSKTLGADHPKTQNCSQSYAFMIQEMESEAEISDSQESISKSLLLSSSTSCVLLRRWSY